MSTAQLLLKEYKYLLYATKRSTPQENRFRIIMPLSHKIYLNAKDFKDFMQNVYDFLPFGVDTQTGQRSRKWLSNKTKAIYNDGELLPVQEFMPRTKRVEERQIILDSQQAMDNVTRWFMNKYGTKNRNNMLLRYALMLVDSNKDFMGIQNAVTDFNKKLPNPLNEAEISSSIMQTVNKKLNSKSQGD